MVVWVTGASSGLGLNTALQLQAAGMTVVAGARSFASKEGESEGGFRLYLDVKDEASCCRFRDRALELYGIPDALCCCAGVLTLGACEEYDRDELRDVMETNFIGMASVVSLVLPLMRENKKGKIVLFSSVNGLLGIPFQGAYTASKHAIEGYAEALRMEVMPYGISVCVIEPGDHTSGSSAYRRRAQKTALDTSPYHDAFQSATRQISHDEATGSDPRLLGREIAKLLAKDHLPCRKIIAKPDQHFAVFMHRVLPVRLFMQIIMKYYVKPIQRGMNQ